MRSQLTASSPLTVAVPLLAGSCRQPTHLDREFKCVTRSYLAAEPSRIESSEERKLAGEAFIGKRLHAADLGDRLAHQHTGQRRSPRKVTREEGFLTGKCPGADSLRARVELGDFVDEEERGPVGQDLVGTRNTHASSSAASSFSGVALGLILYHACSILPFAPIRKAERMIPSYSLP